MNIQPGMIAQQRVDALAERLESERDDLVERVRDAAVEYADSRVSVVERERDALRDEVKRLKQELDLAHEAYLVKDKALRETTDDLRVAKDTIEYAQGRLKSARSRIDTAVALLDDFPDRMTAKQCNALMDVLEVLRGEEP